MVLHMNERGVDRNTRHAIVPQKYFHPRQVSQAQTEPASVSQPGAPQHYNDRQHRRQGQTSIGDQARQLQAAVVSGQAFRLWLERQEDERGTGRDGLVAGAKGEAGGRPKATGRALTHRGVGGGGGGGAGGGQRAGSSRFRSQEHPRVVIKDLDGLEADRVQVGEDGWLVGRVCVRAVCRLQ